MKRTVFRIKVGPLLLITINAGLLARPTARAVVNAEWLASAQTKAAGPLPETGATS